MLIQPKAEPPALHRDALFDHVRQTPVKRTAAAPQGPGAAHKRPKLEPAERHDEREYYEQQQQRARLLTGPVPSKPVTPRPILKQEPTLASSGGKKRVQFSESSPQLTLTVQDMGDTSELVSQLLKQHPELLRGGQSVKVSRSGRTPRSTSFWVHLSAKVQLQMRHLALPDG